MTESFADSHVRDAWDAGAEAWLTFVRSGADYYRLRVHGPALLAACEVRAGERALDLGCGEGYFSRELARRGAHVVAIDLSPKMLEFASEQEGYDHLGIEYRLGSATDLGQQFEPAAFDLVTACMAVQDMSDPAACMKGSAHVLRAGGRMVFSVPHPCTDAPGRVWVRDAEGKKGPLMIDRYFETGPVVFEWNMKRLLYPWSTPYWRRTLAEWTAMTAEAGFLVRRIHEPRPSAEDVEAMHKLDDCARLPYFLIFDLVKP
jgi:2-polyprenyl-3-methyl-5-hydroxy-6-metoxy-1,4-benzoquinol methylase